MRWRLPTPASCHASARRSASRLMAHPAELPGPFVLVDDLDRPVLTGADAHHLERVRRVRPGEPVVLGDGAGRWRPGRVGRGGDAMVEPTGPVEQVDAPSPPLGVGFALTKGDKPELVVQKLTELGVDRIVPFRAARSVVRWDPDRSARATARLRAVARSAAVQCHRPWLPTIDDITDLAHLVAEPGVALAEQGGRPPAPGHRLVLVGPEGGWTPGELDLAAGAGAPRVSFGEHVLRAETAALTVGAVLTALRAGLVEPTEGG